MKLRNEDYDKPVLIVRSAVKRWFKENDCWIKPQSFRDINDMLIKELEGIVERVHKSNMKTVSPKHI